MPSPFYDSSNVALTPEAQANKARSIEAIETLCSDRAAYRARTRSYGLQNPIMLTGQGLITCDACRDCGVEHVETVRFGDSSALRLWVCSNHESSFNICSGCGERGYGALGLYRGPRGENIRACTPCIESLDLPPCASCSTPIHPDNLRGGDCERCYNSNMGRIRDYNYTPEPIFHGRDLQTKAYYGVEVETEYTGGYSGDIDDNDGDGDGDDEEIPVEWVAELKDIKIERMEDLFYPKNDGSLRYGLEVVSHPMSEQYLKIAGGFDHWRSVFNHIKTGGFSCTSGRCGIHVHVSRSAFTRLHLLRAIQIVYGAPSLFKKIARRDGQEYANYEGSDRDFLERKANTQDGNSNPDGKFCAINTGKSHTIEFRIFAGTDNFRVFRASVETVMALVAYSKTKKPPLADNWVEWLYQPDTAPLYPFLVPYLHRKAIVPTTDLTEEQHKIIRTLDRDYRRNR